MIGLLLLATTFLIIIFIGMIVMILDFKKWGEARDLVNQNKLNDLQQRIEDTQKLFQKEVGKILDSFKRLMN